MSDGDQFGRGGGSLEELLTQLVEAQTAQTGLLHELKNIAQSLARSESRESFAEVLNAVNGYMEALDATAAAPSPTGTALPPTQQPLISKEELAVLGGYDELRAALGRDGAAGFYVSATADRRAYKLAIVGEAIKNADTVTVGEKSFAVTNPASGMFETSDPPDEVFKTPQPKVALFSCGRLIGLARFITVKNYAYSELEG